MALWQLNETSCGLNGELIHEETEDQYDK